MKFCQRLHYFSRAGHTKAIWLLYKLEPGAKWLDPYQIIEEGCTGRPKDTAKMANLPNQKIAAKEFREWLAIAKARGIRR